MLEHRYDIRMWESCVDPNPFMVDRQDPDNCIRFQTRERCALEIAAYVFNSVRHGYLCNNTHYCIKVRVAQYALTAKKHVLIRQFTCC